MLANLNLICFHGSGNIFEILEAEPSSRPIYFSVYLVEYVSRDADAARLSYCLKPCSDVDTVTEQIIALHNDIAQMKPYAKSESAILG